MCNFSSIQSATKICSHKWVVSLRALEKCSRLFIQLSESKAPNMELLSPISSIIQEWWKYKDHQAGTPKRRQHHRRIWRHTSLGWNRSPRPNPQVLLHHHHCLTPRCKERRHYKPCGAQHRCHHNVSCSPKCGTAPRSKWG